MNEELKALDRLHTMSLAYVDTYSGIRGTSSELLKGLNDKFGLIKQSLENKDKRIEHLEEKRKNLMRLIGEYDNYFTKIEKAISTLEQVDLNGNIVESLVKQNG